MNTTNNNKNNSFDAVKYMRSQRNALSKKLLKLSKSEILEYFKQKQLENTVKPSA